MRITLVSYLNTKPFIEGLNHVFAPGELQLDLRAPSACADAMRNGECDLALVPVGALHSLGAVEVLTPFCIGARNRVDSVFLFSASPMEDIHTVILDPDSRTSNGLAMILLRSYWNRQVNFVEGKDRDFLQLPPGVARVAIGDAAFRSRPRVPYVRDLAHAWRSFTGLPFVFAVWVAPKGSVSAGMQQRLTEAFQWGTQDAARWASRYAAEFGYTVEEAESYYRVSLDYRLDADKVEGMEKFLFLLEQVFAQLAGHNSVSITD